VSQFFVGGLEADVRAVLLDVRDDRLGSFDSSVLSENDLRPTGPFFRGICSPDFLSLASWRHRPFREKGNFRAGISNIRLNLLHPSAVR